MKRIQTDELLLDYLEGNLSLPDRQKLEAQLKMDAGLRSRLEALRELDVLLTEMKPEQPSGNFTDKVMKGIQLGKPADVLSSKGGLLLLTFMLAVIAIASVLVYSGVFDRTTAIINFNEIDFMQRYLKFSMPAFTIHGRMVINAIIFLNVTLALAMFDRLVLRPFFRRRMEM